jgi:hypothetical protein
MIILIISPIVSFFISLIRLIRGQSSGASMPVRGRLPFV